MKSHADVPFGCRIAEANIHRVTDFPHVGGIGDAGVTALCVRAGAQHDISAGKRLQMPVAQIQFPVFDLLKNSDGRDVLVGTVGVFPAIQQVAPNTKARPAEMFSENNGRFNGRSMVAGRKRKSRS